MVGKDGVTLPTASVPGAAVLWTKQWMTPRISQEMWP